MTNDALVRGICREFLETADNADYSDEFVGIGFRHHLENFRAIIALPPQPVMTEEERERVEDTRRAILQSDGAKSSTYYAAWLLAIIDRYLVQPGNHQSSTSARDAALEEAALFIESLKQQVDGSSTGSVTQTVFNRVYDEIATRIRAMKGGGGEQPIEQWTRDPRQPWRLNLFEQVYQVAVNVTGDQPESQHIATAALEAARSFSPPTNGETS